MRRQSQSEAGAGDRDAGIVGATIFRAWLLLVIAEAPCHGYEVAEGLRRNGLVVWSSGHIYRTLRKLEVAGLLASRWQESTHGAKPRRVYELTADGRVALDDHARALSDLEAQLGQFCVHYEVTRR